MLSKLPPLRNGQPTADWCMAVAEFLDALQTTTGGGGFRSGVTIDKTGMSFQEYDKSVFLATITGRSGSAYAWTRLVSSDGGINGTDGYGAAGTTSYLPAYHVTGATSIANGTVVLMWPADSENEMRFVNGFDPSNLIDLSGRSGSIADVTALQILRGVVSGTASAAVFTPDDASASLPGDVSTGTQTFAGNKTFKNNVVTNSDKSAGAGLIVWGTGATDPVIETDGTSVDIGQNTDSASLSVYGRITSYGDGTAGGVRVSKDYGLTGRYLDLIAGLLPLYTTTNGPYILAKGSTAGPEIALVFNSDLAMGDGGRGVALAGGDSYGIAVAGSFLWGATGTSGGGDTVTGGIITTLGSGPAITNLTYSGSQAATGDISPAQLVANTNDWNPTGW